MHLDSLFSSLRKRTAACLLVTALVTSLFVMVFRHLGAPASEARPIFLHEAQIVSSGDAICVVSDRLNFGMIDLEKGRVWWEPKSQETTCDIVPDLLRGCFTCRRSNNDYFIKHFNTDLIRFDGEALKMPEMTRGLAAATSKYLFPSLIKSDASALSYIGIRQRDGEGSVGIGEFSSTIDGRAPKSVFPISESSLLVILQEVVDEESRIKKLVGRHPLAGLLLDSQVVGGIVIDSDPWPCNVALVDFNLKSITGKNLLDAQLLKANVSLNKKWVVVASANAIEVRRLPLFDAARTIPVTEPCRRVAVSQSGKIVAFATHDVALRRWAIHLWDLTTDTVHILDENVAPDASAGFECICLGFRDDSVACSLTYSGVLSQYDVRLQKLLSRLQIAIPSP
jgi:hypothetical protein